MEQLYINGVSAHLPKQMVTVDAAIGNQWYDQDEARADDYEGARVEPELWPGEMAAKAASSVLADSLFNADDLSFLTFSNIHRHGHKHLWQPAAFLQNELQADKATAMSVQHGCNGLMLATGLAMDHCRVHPKGKALLCSSDRFEHSYFDRWQSDYGLIYGDAAVAVTISKEPGPFEIIHFAQQSAANLESMHRVELPLAESESSAPHQHDIREAKKAFLTEFGKEAFQQTMSDTLTQLRSGLLQDTELKDHMADWLILPNVGKRGLKSVYEPAFADLALDDLWHFGRSVGHTGASDQFLGLHWLQQSGELKSGHLILLVGAGAGFSCSVLLLRVR